MAERVSGFKEETETAGIAGVAIWTTGASGWARKASELLLVPVGSSWAGDDWSVGVDWVNWVDGINGVDWFGNTFGSVPNLSGLTGDAFFSIVVTGRRATSDALSFVIDVMSNALSAFSSIKSELSPTHVVEVGCSVSNGSFIVQGDGQSKGGSVVADDEATDTAEHEVHGIGDGCFILILFCSDVFVVDDVLGG